MLSPLLLAQIDSLERHYGLPRGRLYGLVQAESAGNPQARSHAGAIGLTQLMPGTAKDLGVNPYDPGQNLEGGARYLRQMYDQFGNWDTAQAAYNMGPGALQKRNYVPYQETKQYVQAVKRAQSRYLGTTEEIERRHMDPRETQVLGYPSVSPQPDYGALGTLGQGMTPGGGLMGGDPLQNAALLFAVSMMGGQQGGPGPAMMVMQMLEGRKREAREAAREERRAKLEELALSQKAEGPAAVQEYEYFRQLQPGLTPEGFYQMRRGPDPYQMMMAQSEQQLSRMMANQQLQNEATIAAEQRRPGLVQQETVARATPEKQEEAAALERFIPKLHNVQRLIQDAELPLNWQLDAASGKWTGKLFAGIAPEQKAKADKAIGIIKDAVLEAVQQLKPVTDTDRRIKEEEFFGYFTNPESANNWIKSKLDESTGKLDQLHRIYGIDVKIPEPPAPSKENRFDTRYQQLMLEYKNDENAVFEKMMKEGFMQ